MIRVLVPSQLQSYCQGASRLQARGHSIDEVLRDLDRRFPGFRFRIVDEQDRIRRHMRIFVGRESAGDVGVLLDQDAEIMIVGALSGG